MRKLLDPAESRLCMNARAAARKGTAPRMKRCAGPNSRKFVCIQLRWFRRMLFSELLDYSAGEPPTLLQSTHLESRAVNAFHVEAPCEPHGSRTFRERRRRE